MDRFKAILLITSTCLTTTLYAKQQVVCVFDPIGILIYNSTNLQSLSGRENGK
nr:hypothetical protein [Acinetobacter baumannii]EKU6933822.1 hypothetical protein [Acinetobacter baumannii]EKU7161121.1 hypothetical protein [Acinetobacter baumannii]EKU7175935.1 hypothetical protein [Acinetobacter baumannii]EKV5480702.1 hypothetical protein [Acinetobacter baumannii]